MSDQKNPVVSPPQQVSSGLGAERNAGIARNGEIVTAVTAEVQMPQEVKEAGIENIPNEGTVVEIPPDIKKMGVTLSGPTTPVATSSSGSQVQIPIAYNQVIQDSKGPVTSALTWLAIWCLKKFKKMHYALKTINGKTVAMKEN